jgi:hypothetical protein
VIDWNSGSLNTIQDLGRPAWRHGVSVSGVMDPLALRAGNALLGNEENAAAIEVQMFPLACVSGGHWIALTGADCRARLDGDELPAWWGCAVRKDRCPVRRRAHAACVAGALMSLWFWARAVPLRGGLADSRGSNYSAATCCPVVPGRGATPGFRDWR